MSSGTTEITGAIVVDVVVVDVVVVTSTVVDAGDVGALACTGTSIRPSVTVIAVPSAYISFMFTCFGVVH